MSADPSPGPISAGRCRGLLRRRERWCLTWRGWLALLILLLITSLPALRLAHGFLAISAPVISDVLVLEGWAPDFAVTNAVAEFRRGGYQNFIVTGGPIERGAPLSEYRTYAELGAATVSRLGIATNVLNAVPAPEVRRDRTFASATALKAWFQTHGGVPRSVNVISVGPHARRTRLLFQRAFGAEIHIGIIAVPEEGYDRRRWWAYSLGFRTVVDEWVAYLYARLLFNSGRG